jgi:hypothetical protein
MGTLQSTDLNRDTNNVPTSGEYADTGVGVSKWLHWFRIPDGGNATQGLKADAAVTDPTASGTVVAILKGLLTTLRLSPAGILKAEDAAAASGDSGVMALAIRRDSPTSDAAAGDYHGLHVDALGRLRALTRLDELNPTNATTTALAETLVVKAAAGKLYGVQGYTAADGFVQVHNKASAPASTNVPVLVIPVLADTPFSLDLGYGRAFPTGIAVGFSSVGPTFTGGGSSMWIDAQYE